MTLAASASGVSAVMTLSSASICSSTAAIVEIELAGDLARDALRARRLRSSCFRAEKALADVGERRALFLQAQDERNAPVDVGAAVEVVADPGGERRQLGAQLVRLVAEAAAPQR